MQFVGYIQVPMEAVKRLLLAEAAKHGVVIDGEFTLEYAHNDYDGDPIGFVAKIGAPKIEEK